jgi:hypothetical protein
VTTSIARIDFDIYPRPQVCRLENALQIELYPEDQSDEWKSQNGDGAYVEMADGESPSIVTSSSKYTGKRLDTSSIYGIRELKTFEVDESGEAVETSKLNSTEATKKIADESSIAAEQIRRNFIPTTPLINRKIIKVRRHETNEDEVYNLRHTILTGDVKAERRVALNEFKSLVEDVDMEETILKVNV